MLSYQHKFHFVRTVILPAATYAFLPAYITPVNLAKLDRLSSSICNKHAMGLPTHMAITPRQKVACMGRKEQSTPLGVNLMRSQVLYRAAHVVEKRFVSTRTQKESKTTT